MSVGVGFDAVEVELAGLTDTARRLMDCHSLDAGLPDADTDADTDADADGGVSFDGGDDD